MEKIDKRLDLATAMAISGAAVSAIWDRTPCGCSPLTLALLNIRLGYWLRNPRHLRAEARRRRPHPRQRRHRQILSAAWRCSISSTRTVATVFLSDGGHIENLGVYELLKRGCKTIVVIDAEADPTMSFGSLRSSNAMPASISARAASLLSGADRRAMQPARRPRSLAGKGPHCAARAHHL